MGVCNCSLFCCTLLYVHSSIAIILVGKRELVALLYLSSWCLVVPQGCLRFVIVVFPDHTHLLFFIIVKHLNIFHCNMNNKSFDYFKDQLTVLFLSIKQKT